MSSTLLKEKLFIQLWPNQSVCVCCVGIKLLAVKLIEDTHTHTHTRLIALIGRNVCLFKKQSVDQNKSLIIIQGWQEDQFGFWSNFQNKKNITICLTFVSEYSVWCFCRLVFARQWVKPNFNKLMMKSLERRWRIASSVGQLLYV